MKNIKCGFRKAEYSNNVILFITDTEAIIDSNKSEWCGRSKEHALDRVNKQLNPIGYNVVISKK